MRKLKDIVLMVVSIAILLGSALGQLSALERKIPATHPVELVEMPVCTECHSDDTGVALKPVAAFNHSAGFVEGHRFYASQASRLCNACHKSAFCADCHATRAELKPSEKYAGSPERWLPHRGDYLYQHRIDGRLDPTGCYRCHGRQNNRVCIRCHR